MNETDFFFHRQKSRNWAMILRQKEGVGIAVRLLCVCGTKTEVSTIFSCYGMGTGLNNTSKNNLGMVLVSATAKKIHQNTTTTSNKHTHKNNKKQNKKRKKREQHSGFQRGPPP